MGKCVFCEKIAEGNLQTYGKAVVFEPLNPVTEGHKLVVPMAHARRLSQMTMGDKAHLFNALSIATGQLPNYNIINSCGADATQTVEHIHFHIVPRKKGDGLKLPWTGQAEPHQAESGDGE
jgi:histidine triad (HIT) family protein